jgi:hypothetical protein
VESRKEGRIKMFIKKCTPVYPATKVCIIGYFRPFSHSRRVYIDPEWKDMVVKAVNFMISQEHLLFL